MQKKINIKNPQLNVLLFWIVAGLLSIILEFWLINYTNYYALIFITLFFIVTSVICIIVFWKRYSMLQKAIIDGEYIAVLNYSKDEWKEYLANELKIEMQEKKGVFVSLSAITLPVFGIMILIAPEGKLWLFIVMLILIAVYAFMAFFVPKISYRLTKQKNYKVIILGKGVLLGKTFHNWNMLFSKLEKVGIKDKPFRNLRIVYSYFDRFGKRSYTIRIPIPVNFGLDKIRDIIERLIGENRIKK